MQGVGWERVPASIPFGKAIHVAVAQYYRKLKAEGKPPALGDLVRVFAALWNKESADPRMLYKEDETADELFKRGIALLKVFLGEVRPQRIEAVERPFAVDLIDYRTGEVFPVKLVGVFDLVESDEAGNLIITELKTAARKYTEEKIDASLQGSIYSYALEQLGHLTTGRSTLIRYDVLLKTKKPAMERHFVVRDTFAHRRMVAVTRDILRAIEHEVFSPVVDWHCKECPFKTRCDTEP